MPSTTSRRSRFANLRARAKQQQLKADFEAYLDGFSPNVQEILDKFEFNSRVPKLAKADILGSLIEKFTSNDINLGPKPVFDQDGNVRLPGLDNHAKTQIGYEVSFTRYFYKPTPLRSLDEIKADLLTLQDEAEGLLDQIIAPGGTPA